MNDYMMNMAWHDSQYLFRLTSTFGWEEVESFCDQLVREIEGAASKDAIKDVEDTYVSSCSPSTFNDSLHSRGGRTFKALEDWLELAKNQLMYQDQWGNNCLHAASYVRPPAEIINALFEVGRAIWKFSTIMPRIPIWAMPSKDNSTPFLVACSTGTSFEGIRRHLAEIDHYIEQQWVSPYARMLVLHPDNQGTTPLRGWSSFHNRKWIYFPNANLTDYIDVATRMLWHATRSVYPEYPITKEMILLRSTQIASQFPESLIHLLFADDDNEILAMSRDFKRRMPLHNAIDAHEATPGLFYDLICYGAKETVTAESLLTYECNYCHERNRICMIELLLTWYPNAARENYPSGGQTPLCRALSRGDHWHTPHSERGVIQMLCDSAPDKLEEIDSETGLYPFMLAATIHGECSSETDVVDTIYQLLRHHPQPIIDSLQQN